jgi:hypothetical protein
MYHQKAISRKTFFKLFFFGVLKVNDKKQNPDPNADPLVRGIDPHQNVMDPELCF